MVRKARLRLKQQFQPRWLPRTYVHGVRWGGHIKLPGRQICQKGGISKGVLHSHSSLRSSFFASSSAICPLCTTLLAPLWTK